LLGWSVGGGGGGETAAPHCRRRRNRSAKRDRPAFISRGMSVTYGRSEELTYQTEGDSLNHLPLIINAVIPINAAEASGYPGLV